MIKKGEALPRKFYKLTRKQCQFEGCEKSFSTKQRLVHHENLVHRNQAIQYSCTHCDYATFERQTLVTHLRTHTGEQPYTCRYCNRGFSIAGNRNDHEKRHLQLKQTLHNLNSNYRPYKCEQCGEGFYRNYLRVQHQKLKCQGKRTDSTNQEEAESPECKTKSKMADDASKKLNRHQESQLRKNDTDKLKTLSHQNSDVTTSCNTSQELADIQNNESTFMQSEKSQIESQQAKEDQQRDILENLSFPESQPSQSIFSDFSISRERQEKKGIYTNVFAQSNYPMMINPVLLNTIRPQFQTQSYPLNLVGSPLMQYIPAPQQFMGPQYFIALGPCSINNPSINPVNNERLKLQRQGLINIATDVNLTNFRHQ